jgi:ring-1,2-phenylacetyl-CoA epoxidase subunit PaaC
MIHPVPAGVSPESLAKFILALADDELVLGHRDSEWTGYAPILEEDIAFSNIAQDELGHALVWFTFYEELTGKNPDSMVFKREWRDFTNCRLVEYPKSDFAYTVVRQYLFDAAEHVKLRALQQSSYAPLAAASGRILKEESYHLLHSESLLNRLGDATEESSHRMQEAVDLAFPQSLGIFEPLSCENELCSSGVGKENEVLQKEWLNAVAPALAAVSLKIPVRTDKNTSTALCEPDFGGRKGEHTQHLRSLVIDLQTVLKIAPEAQW